MRYSNSLRGSPTARKYSLLFGGAYAPNDAIYRKRYAFTEIIMPYNFYFPRARPHKQLLTVYSSLTVFNEHLASRGNDSWPWLYMQSRESEAF